MTRDIIQQQFLELVRAGLFPDHNARIIPHGIPVDWKKVYLLAQEQSVLGLLLQGIEELRAKGLELSMPKELLLQWIGEVQFIEQQNKDMNAFVAELFGQLGEAGINALLVKGQGIAQCYERPLWRSSGDVDLLLTEEDYEKAKALLLPQATDVETEYTHFKHLGMTINEFVVELHGTSHSRLSGRVDSGIDDVQMSVFYEDRLRFVEFKDSNGSKVQVALPAPDEDAIFVFTHILHHFFFEGIGLRQICDWCRLLWMYKDSLDYGVLESRIQKMGLMTEWKAFAAFAVKWLGMPAEAMPLYSVDARWERKAGRICSFVLEVGNFGHKQRRDYSGMSYIVRKFVSLWGRLSDMLRHFPIFPKDSILFFGGVLRSGLHAAVKGE